MSLDGTLASTVTVKMVTEPLVEVLERLVLAIGKLQNNSKSKLHVGVQQTTLQEVR